MCIRDSHKPDWTWIKPRDATGNHRITDAVRGVTKQIYADLNNAENTNTNGLTAFGTDGFTVGSDGGYNGNGVNFASWNWKAGTSVSGNTTGSGTYKTYTGSVDTTAGFSIIKYTGNGTAGHTIPHHLGVAPSVVFVKGLGVADWSSYHSVLGNTGYMRLNNTNAFASASTYWNNTSPTSSVFTAGTTGNINANGNTYIAYCFAEKQGYSKFGSYTGNGSASSGTFVYLGFKPAFLMVKRTNASGHWQLVDTKRPSYNPQYYLRANSNNVEATDIPFDIVSNGFKTRSTDTSYNGSGDSYIYMAFAEEPFVANVGASIPATAR